MRLLKPALIYFLLVFGTGFVLGTVRVLWIAPRVGDEAAQLVEMPAMLIAIVWAARWTNGRLPTAFGPSSRFFIGVIALGLMLAAEITVGMTLRGQSLIASLLFRDPLVGAAYYAALAAFALMPWLLEKKSGRAE
jgi:hypothetical protein